MKKEIRIKTVHHEGLVRQGNCQLLASILRGFGRGRLWIWVMDGVDCHEELTLEEMAPNKTTNPTAS
jgi:hypothetical protein